MVKNTLSSVKRDAAIGQQAQAARQHQQRLHTLFPAGREAANVLVLDGPGESRPSGQARHNNDSVSFRHAPTLLSCRCCGHQLRVLSVMAHRLPDAGRLRCCIAGGPSWEGGGLRPPSITQACTA